MVGRGVEVGIAHQALQNVGRIVVSGVAGVGKTRLARELLQRCKSDGMDAMWVAGSISSARVPFGAFANHLRNLRTRRGAPARDNLEVLLGAQQAIVERAVDRRLLLAVDDAHLLDEASARLTVQLASSTHRVSVALTVGEGKRSPDTIATTTDSIIHCSHAA